MSCEAGTGRELEAVLTTEQGWELQYPNGRFAAVGVDRSKLPASLLIEVLREEGTPENVVNNVPMNGELMPPLPQGCGCQMGPGGALALGVLLLLSRLRSLRRRAVSAERE